MVKHTVWPLTVLVVPSGIDNTKNSYKEMMMKFRSVTLVCSLIASLASALSFILDKVGIWYDRTVENNIAIEATIGCVRQDMM